MKHQIKHRYSGAVLFECELPDDTPAGLVTRYTLEKATTSRADLYEANLSGAHLSGANLSGANLYGADLSRANLYEANLSGAHLSRANLYEANLSGADLYEADLYEANLSGANLSGANLSGANLYGADLYEANLSGADLYEAKLVGERPILQIGPIGSRCSYFMAYMTDQGVRLKAGCFFGTVEEFTAKLTAEHGDNAHAKEYRAALALIECHAELWALKTEGVGNE